MRYRDTWDKRDKDEGFVNMILRNKSNSEMSNIYNLQTAEYLLKYDKLIMGNTIKYKEKGYSDLCLRRDNGECDRRCLPVYFNYDETTLKSNFGKHPQGDIVFPVGYSTFLDEYIPQITLFGSPITTVKNANSSEFSHSSAAMYFHNACLSLFEKIEK